MPGFLTVPREVRDQIYEQCVAMASMKERPFRDCRASHVFETSIFRVNRQIYKEAKETFYKNIQYWYFMQKQSENTFRTFQLSKWTPPLFMHAPFRTISVNVGVHRDDKLWPGEIPLAWQALQDRTVEVAKQLCSWLAAMKNLDLLVLGVQDMPELHGKVFVERSQRKVCKFDYHTLFQPFQDLPERIHIRRGNSYFFTSKMGHQFPRKHVDMFNNAIDQIVEARGGKATGGDDVQRRYLEVKKIRTGDICYKNVYTGGYYYQKQFPLGTSPRMEDIDESLCSCGVEP